MLYVSLAAIYSCHPDFVPSDFSRFKPYVIGPLFSKESSLSTKVYAAECLGHVAARSDIFESEEELEKVVEVFFKIGEEIAGKRADDKEYGKDILFIFFLIFFFLFYYFLFYFLNKRFF